MPMLPPRCFVDSPAPLAPHPSGSYAHVRRPQSRFVAWLQKLGVLNQWVNIITYAIAGKADAMIPGTFTVRA